jgi:hypothetical protein
VLVERAVQLLERRLRALGGGGALGGAEHRHDVHVLLTALRTAAAASAALCAALKAAIFPPALDDAMAAQEQERALAQRTQLLVLQQGQSAEAVAAAAAALRRETKERQMHPNRTLLPGEGGADGGAGEGGAADGAGARAAFDATLRGRLVGLMTSVDTDVKRAASELLWLLCAEDEAEFASRAGIGSSISLLRTKGGALAKAFLAQK